MFVKGKSGNPSGRPKADKVATKSRAALVKEAWEKLTSKKPWIVQEALERGLTGGRPLGFLELGARVMKEIGQNEEQKTSVTIIMNSSLDPKALKPAVPEVHVIEDTAHPEVPAKTEVGLSLLETPNEPRE